MALLMLSLIMSIVGVKLLHHGGQEVRDMSLSACLLHAYAQTAGGALISTDPPTEQLQDDYSLEGSLEEDLLSLSPPQDAPSGLDWLLQELVVLRRAVSEQDSEGSVQAQWRALCLKLDVLLFRVYVLLFCLYTGTLLLLWAGWSRA
ncbi:unnamed protein product [Knipowitschia caucasica]